MMNIASILVSAAVSLLSVAVVGWTWLEVFRAARQSYAETAGPAVAAVLATLFFPAVVVMLWIARAEAFSA